MGRFTGRAPRTSEPTAATISRRYTIGLFAWALAVPVGTLLTGCDLLDLAKNPTITFDLPARTYSLSTQDSHWKSPPTTFSQKLDCATVADCCMPPGAPAGASTIDCSAYPLACDTGQCAIEFLLEVPRAVNLAKEAPALAGQNSKVISQISLTALKYTLNNQLGVELPPVNVYVAPATVMTGANTPEATLLATLPMSEAGAQVMDTINLTPEAQAAFTKYARDSQTPFNLIASTTVLLHSGSPAPQGKVDITVTGTVSAKF